MAVLATLEQANVLPPESSREANQIVKSVIQLQSIFIKSSTPAIRQFVHDAVHRKYGGATDTLLERFRSTGWTAEVLEALSDSRTPTSVEELETLTEGLRQFNLSVDDLRGFLQLMRDGQLAITAQGKTLSEVYMAHRRHMPGQ